MKKDKKKPSCCMEDRVWGKRKQLIIMLKFWENPCLESSFQYFKTISSRHIYLVHITKKSFAKDLLDRESNIILLDEFDKANPVFHSAFYQLFDEGKYEDQNYYVKLEKSYVRQITLTKPKSKRN